MAKKDTLPDREIWGQGHFPNPITPDENILFIIREDVSIISFKALFYLAILCSLLLIRALILSFVNSRLPLALFDTAFFGIIAFMVTTFTLIFHRYYLSMGIITDKRVIDIDQTSLFKREVNDMDISNVQDVNYKQVGFWGTIFDFGDVVIQTAGGAAVSNSPSTTVEKPTGFVFDNVPNPKQIGHLISKIYQAQHDSDTRSAARMQAEELAKHMRAENL
jgi:hypothetical protein